MTLEGADEIGEFFPSLTQILCMKEITTISGSFHYRRARTRSHSLQAIPRLLHIPPGYT